MTDSYINYCDYYVPDSRFSMNDVLSQVDDTRKNKNYILK